MFPIFLDLGFKSFPFYEGIWFFISIISAVFWSFRRWKKSDLKLEHFDKVLIYALFGAILGARISHFVFWDWELLVNDPLSFFRFWEGGLSVTGGLLGGFLGGWIACRNSEHGFFQVFKLFSPPVLLGQALGRVGCFLNGDAFGYPSSLPWACRFPRYATRIPGFGPAKEYSSYPWIWCYERGLVEPNSTLSLPMHPTQIYESALDILLMIGILIMLRKGKDSRDEGEKALGRKVFLLHVGGYSLIRFFLEFLRADGGPPVLWGLSMLQMILFLVIAFSFVRIILSRRSPR